MAHFAGIVAAVLVALWLWNQWRTFQKVRDRVFWQQMGEEMLRPPPGAYPSGGYDEPFEAPSAAPMPLVQLPRHKLAIWPALVFGPIGFIVLLLLLQVVPHVPH